MSFKKTLLTIALVLALLGPLALLLRTQNPWNCFMMTKDESYFTQAISNWKEGRGYRLHHESKPFDPGISVGLPMAWGTIGMQKLVRTSLAESGRLWVHTAFYALLVLIFAVALKRSRSWAGALVALGFFGFIFSKIPFAGYVTYGVLGEIPALLISVLALLALDRGWRFTAGVLVVGAYWTKPTFAFLIPALSLASLIRFRWKGLATVLASGLSLFVLWKGLSGARGETIAEYLRVFKETAGIIALTNIDQRFWDYYRESGALMTVLSVAIVAAGAFGIFWAGIRRRPVLWTSELAGWLFFGIGVVYYLAVHRKPIPKQWLVFLSVPTIFLSLRLGTLVGPWLSRFFPDSVLRVVTLAVMVTWLVNIPSLEKRRFMRAGEEACPFKEQRVIDARLTALKDKGEVTPENLSVLVPDSAAVFFLYELGWNPPYHETWTALSKPPRGWVTGDNRLLLPAPEACRVEWKGSQFSILKCGG